MTTKWILSHVKHLNKEYEWKIVSNLFKSISIIYYARVRFHEEYFDEIMEIYIQNIIDYIYS